MSSIDKFYYLTGCLNEDPLESLKGITLSENTYNLDLSTLKKHYDNPPKLTSSIVDSMFAALVATMESTTALRTFLNEFHEGIALLELLQI